jgi:polygalacturonase
MKLSVVCSSALLGLAAAQVPSFVANVLDYGAKGDGTTMNTAAIVKAIAAIEANQGGTLLFPSGTYLSAPVNLTSNMVLYLNNATLLASANFSDWDIIAPLPSYGRGRDFPGPRYTSFLHAYNVTNLHISGSGAGTAFVNGQGAPWWAAIVGKQLEVTPGHLFECLWSDGIEISNVTFQDSPFWHTHIWSSNNAWVHDMSIEAPIHSTNTDGVDPDSSSNVVIERVNIAVGDDCIAVKSGWDRAGVSYGVPTNNVTIRDMVCATQSACIAIGSEMSGGVSNVEAYNISCLQSGQGLNVKSALGRGGYITNISFHNVTFGPGFTGTAFAAADTYRDQYPPAPIDPTLIPLVNGIYISNLTMMPGSVGRAGDFQGLGTTLQTGEITGVYLENIALGGATSTYTCVNVTGSTGPNVVPAPCPQLQ